MRSTGALTNGALQPAVRTMSPITAALPEAMPALLLLRAIKNSPFLRPRAPAAHQGEADQNGLAELPQASPPTPCTSRSLPRPRYLPGPRVGLLALDAVGQERRRLEQDWWPVH